MTKTILSIEGMQCGMCEAHVNDAIRNSFPVKKVSSSRSKGETVIVTDTDIDEARLRQAIDETGYTVLSIQREPYEKKGLFGFKK